MRQPSLHGGILSHRGEGRVTRPSAVWSAAVDAARAVMVAAAGAGGAVARERQSRGFSVTVKGDGSPVTDADRDAEAAVAGVLTAAYPEHGWLGEETGAHGPAGRRFI